MKTLVIRQSKSHCKYFITSLRHSRVEFSDVCRLNNIKISLLDSSSERRIMFNNLLLQDFKKIIYLGTPFVDNYEKDPDSSHYAFEEWNAAILCSLSLYKRRISNSYFLSLPIYLSSSKSFQLKILQEIGIETPTIEIDFTNEVTGKAKSPNNKFFLIVTPKAHWILFCGGTYPSQMFLNEEIDKIQNFMDVNYINWLTIPFSIDKGKFVGYGLSQLIPKSAPNNIIHQVVSEFLES